MTLLCVPDFVGPGVRAASSLDQRPIRGLLEIFAAKEAFSPVANFHFALHRTILINSTRGPFNFGKCGHGVDGFDCGRIRFA
jgi:hypothetical protein